ncbi:MAG: N4-gp56 family major capsid protein [Oscillospiraceae bacterium]
MGSHAGVPAWAGKEVKMAINLTEKYSNKVADRFSKQSMTAAAASDAYSFEGVKTLKVYSVDTVPLANYNRSGGMARFGSVSDLGDTVQEMTMTQDKAFTYSIDKGNAKEQMNVKAATKSLKRQLDEVVIPTMDKYRLDRWARMAGSQEVPTAAPNKNTITGLIMNCTETLDNALVPEAGRTMFVTTAMYKELKQNPEFLNVDALAKESLVKGQVGEIDGMKVVKVPTSYLPTGVYWLITYKDACLAPAKLQDYKIHKDPPGINGKRQIAA